MACTAATVKVLRAPSERIAARYSPPDEAPTDSTRNPITPLQHRVAMSTTHNATISHTTQSATLKHMADIGIRALKQNASAVVAQAAAGATLTITDRGRPVAQLSPLPSTRLQTLLESGRARPARKRLADLAAARPGAPLSAELASMRDAERS